MTNYKEILTSSNDKIKKMYYHYFLLNNFCLIEDFSSFQESLFDKNNLNEEEKEQLIYVLKYLFDNSQNLFQLVPFYIQRLKQYFIFLSKDKQYKQYRKDIVKKIVFIEVLIKTYKEHDTEMIWENYKTLYGFNGNLNPTIPLFEKLVSSNLLMFNYLFFDYKPLNDIVKENFQKEKVFYASSLFYIFNTLSINCELILPMLDQKMTDFINNYIENESNEQILLFGQKLNILFEKYLKIYGKNNILFLPERPVLVYKDEPLNGKVLKFQKEDS